MIRLANKNDVAALQLMLRKLFEEYHNIDTCYDNPTDSEILDDVNNGIEKGLYTVFTSADSVIGFIKTHINKDKHLGCVDNIFVMNEHRGKRVATKLIENFKLICKKENITRLQLTSDLRSDAYVFWKNQGFTPFASRMNLNV